MAEETAEPLAYCFYKTYSGVHPSIRKILVNKKRQVKKEKLGIGFYAFIAAIAAISWTYSIDIEDIIRWIVIAVLVLVGILWLAIVMSNNSGETKQYKNTYNNHSDDWANSEIPHEDDPTDEPKILKDKLNQEEQFASTLGLSGKVTKNTIKKAYRQKTKEYHPDRVRTMGKDIQELASLRMREINEAYEYFEDKYDLY